MGPTLFYGAKAEHPPPKKNDFAMKQTNICRLSGDIINILCTFMTSLSGGELVILFYTFQQDDAPAHRSSETVTFWCTHVPALIEPAN